MPTPGCTQPWLCVRQRARVACSGGLGPDGFGPHIRHPQTHPADTDTPQTQMEQRMPFANFKVPAGTLTEEQKEQIITRTTELYVDIYGERARATTLVLVEEVTDGGWGIGGNVLTLAELRRTAGS